MVKYFSPHSPLLLDDHIRVLEKQMVQLTCTVVHTNYVMKRTLQLPWSYVGYMDVPWLQRHHTVDMEYVHVEFVRWCLSNANTLWYKYNGSQVG